MSFHTAAKGLGERPAASELQEVLEGFLEFGEVNGLPKNQLGRIRAVLAALESEEVLEEGQAVAKRWPVQGRKGYFLALDLDLRGPDSIPIRYVILAVKEEP